MNWANVFLKSCEKRICAFDYYFLFLMWLLHLDFRLLNVLNK